MSRMPIREVRSEMDHIHVPNGPIGELETQNGTEFLESLPPGGARVEVNHAPQLLDSCDPERMGVPTDEHVGRIVLEAGSHRNAIPTRNASDMGHPDADSLPPHLLMRWISGPELLAVDIAMDTEQWGYRFEPFGDLEGPEIPGVPDLVSSFEVLQHPVVEVAVRVGQ